MPWLFFGLAIGCFAVAMKTHSIGLALLCLLAALGLLLAGVLGLVSARIQSRSQDASALLGPEQLALIRKRGQAQAANEPPDLDSVPADRGKDSD